MVRELFEIALDMCGGECGTTAREDIVDVIPRQQCTVISAAYTCLVTALGKHRGHAGYRPPLGLSHGDIVLRILKVVDIRGIVLSASCRTGDELCKLTGESYP